MRKKTLKISILIFLCLIAGSCFLILTGCSNSSTNSTSTTKESNSVSNESMLSEYFGKYYRLTHDKFLLIRNNEDQVLNIYIYYSTRSNYTQVGPPDIPQEYLVLTLGAGYKRTGVYLKTLKTLDASYDFERTDTTPPERVYLENTFQSSEIEQIFTYLETYQDFFFNGAEFTAVGGEPYNSPGVPMQIDDYTFTLSFGIPDTLHDYWTISKSTDDPDSIMQGIITIMENNFVSHFEQ